MSSLSDRFGRDLKRRYVRSGVLQLACELEVLETRALMSAMTEHAGAAVAAAQAGSQGDVHRSAEGELHHAPTPIANLTGNPLTFSDVAGVPAVQDVATITSTTIPAKLNGYKVSIDWGDGTTTKGSLVKDKAGLIHVKGRHAYAAVGSFTVNITVTQTKPKPAAGQTAPTLTMVSTANVTQNSANGVTVTPTAGTAFSGVVGSFSLPAGDTTTDVATLKAFIKWGDHSFSLGTVTLNGDGTYSVSGDHTYAAAGTFRIKVFVVQTVPTVTSAAAASSSDDSGDFKGRVKCDFRRVRFIAAIYSTAVVGTTPPPVV